MIRLLLQLIAFVLFATSAKANLHQSSAQLRILFIGNSLTGFYNSPVNLAHLAASRGYTPEIEEYIAFGQTLSYQLTRSDIREALANQKWDYVVLQEQSTLPLLDPSSFRQSVVLFDQLIKQNGAQTVLFENWSLRGQNKIDQLNATYADVATEVGASVVPLAQAWDYVTKNSNIDLYLDDRHPDEIAGYMNACLFFKFFFHESPVGLVHEGTVKNSPDVFGGAAPDQPFENLDNTYGSSSVIFIQQTADRF